jgi:hypothetical protein
MQAVRMKLLLPGVFFAASGKFFLTVDSIYPAPSMFCIWYLQLQGNFAAAAPTAVQCQVRSFIL